jgi:hypothetical protein
VEHSVKNHVTPIWQACYCKVKYIHTPITGRYNTKVHWAQATWYQLGNSVYDGHNSIILYIDIQLWRSLSVFIQNLKLKCSAATRWILPETICELHEVVSFEICSHGTRYFWYWYAMSNKTPRSESASELYYTIRPYSRFSRQEPLLFYQVAPQLYSRVWVEPVPDPLHFFFW